MRIFLCGLPKATESLKRDANKLSEAGHEIYSQWIYLKTPRSDEDYAEEAMNDLRDLIKSDCVMALLYGPANGAKDAIFGAGVAFNKRMIVIGPKNNPFHYLPMVERYASIKDFLKASENQ